MDSNREIRWGILGPGFVANMFAEDLARVRDARCVAVASRDAKRAQAFAARHGVRRCYDNYDALAADPEVDVVYIATPHSHHFEHAGRMLAGGKAVLVEKPFTMTAAQAAELAAYARAYGRAARWHPTRTSGRRSSAAWKFHA